MERASENAAVIEAMRELHEVEDLGRLEANGTDEGIGDLLVIPSGKSVVDTKPFRDARLTAPERRKGTSKHTTLDSFIDFVKRFEDADSAVFVGDSPKAPSIIAVLDYHRRGADGAPRFGAHRAVYDFPLSDAWKAWVAVAGPESPWMSQAQMAAWIEDRIADVSEPDAAGTTVQEYAAKLGFELATPAQLLALSRGLSIKVDLRVKNAVTLQSGVAHVVFEETHQAEGGGNLQVPGGFAITIPVFRGGAPYIMGARLRYKHHDGKISWRIVLNRLDAVLENAITTEVALVDTHVQSEVFFGTPES